MYIYIEDYTLTAKNLEHLAKVNWDRFPYTLTLIWPMWMGESAKTMRYDQFSRSRVSIV